MIELAKGAKRTILDYKLSSYACYFIVQIDVIYINEDKSVKIIFK